MKHNQKKYDTSQQIFYTVCETGWDLCLRHLADFAELKSMYTPAYISNAMQAVKNAEENIPTVHTLRTIKQHRISMVKAAGQVLHNWQILKVYITQAYSPDYLKVALSSAGSSLYKKASLQNWATLRSLVRTAENFMSSNFTELTANQNMPPAFPAKFTAAAHQFLEIGNIFFEAKFTKEAVTSHKIKANNVVYDTLIAMMKDARQIFRDRPEIKKQFVFSNIASAYENRNTSRAHVTASGKNLSHNTNLISQIAINAEGEINEMKNVA